MSKFKIGDRVLIRRPKDTNEEPFWDVSAMDHLHERVATIIGFDDDGWLRIDGERWVLSDSWCEPFGLHVDTTTLTRRDHFAMAALPAIIEISSAGQHDPGPVGGDMTRAQRIVFDCYELADAMEAARNKEGGE